MTCHVRTCREQAMLNRYFCPVHDAAWMASPERARAVAIDVAPHTMSMLGDFTRRVDLEGAALAPVRGQQ